METGRTKKAEGMITATVAVAFEVDFVEEADGVTFFLKSNTHIHENFFVHLVFKGVEDLELSEHLRTAMENALRKELYNKLHAKAAYQHKQDEAQMIPVTRPDPKAGLS